MIAQKIYKPVMDKIKVRYVRDGEPVEVFRPFLSKKLHMVVFTDPRLMPKIDLTWRQKIKIYTGVKIKNPYVVVQVD